MNRTIERIELNIPPIPKDRISACRRLVDDSRLPHEIRQLAELLVDASDRMNLVLGAFEFGCAVITDDVSENNPRDYVK
jgi:hypothetical protein